MEVCRGNSVEIGRTQNQGPLQYSVTHAKRDLMECLHKKGSGHSKTPKFVMKVSQVQTEKTSWSWWNCLTNMMCS